MFCCIICGHLIYDCQDLGLRSWLGQFRILYSSSGDVCISDVGLFNDPSDSTWTAPARKNVQWNNLDYPLQANDIIPVMRQRPANGRHGYVLHNACWCLLEKAFDTEIVPLERLLKVCDSLPFPLRWEGVCWGHDYGGLVLLDDENYYPWEDRLKEQAIDSEIYDYARANPYDIVDISRLRAIPSDCPPNTMLSGQGNDCFKVLPWEILEAIAILLPTKDALILRRASKSFAPIFVSQSFWASKFEPGRERDLIFEKRNCKEPRDWRSLYGSTSRATSVPGLQNRWRIWSLIQLLREPLRLRMGDNLRVLSANMNSINLRWISIAGDVRQELGTGYYARFNEGCRVLYEQYTLVPDNLSKLAFSIIEASDGTYVVGLRLIYDPVMDICLGYIAEGKEIFVDVKVLRGLVVAIGPRGIRALQVINGEKTRSRWLGCPRNSPITERLRGSGSTAALKVGFDGYKLVALGLAGKARPYNQNWTTQNLSLREDALWYPAVPDVDLCLNEASFIGESPSTAGYRPLCWTLFGGTNGIYLRHLTQVAVTRLGKLVSIEFLYETNGVPDERRKLGRHSLTENSETMRFPIDGPGGEIITMVESSIERIDREGVYSLYKHGKLSSFKITTNRGRSFHFKASGVPSDDVVLEPLSVVAGTTIVGFYASQHQEAGLLDFGIISVVIEEETQVQRD